MSTLKPWRGQAPTIEEAADYLSQEAEFLTGESETTTPPEVRPLGRWTGSERTLRTVTKWAVDAAIVEYGYWSHYYGREAIVTRTLLQVTQGGLAPDGWATFDVYMVPRGLTHEEAEQMATLILAGLPVRIAGGEL